MIQLEMISKGFEQGWCYVQSLDGTVKVQEVNQKTLAQIIVQAIFHQT